MQLVYYYLFLLLFPSLFAVEIAITLDDHPLPNGPLFTVHERIERFCTAFEKVGAKGAFFCIGSACKGKPYLSSLNEKGHFLANHSLNHKHFSSTKLDDFRNEIVEAEILLNQYTQFRKWFRYPYLDYGNRLENGGDEEKYRAGLTLLKELDYKEGFVTINTYDWYLNACLRKKIQEKKKINYEQLKKLYLALIEEWCNYYIAAYQALFSEEISHVLLLHANDLNALFLDDILSMIREKGWRIISPEEVFKDPSWRGVLLNQTKMIPKSPSSLNCQAIDELLKPVFS